MSFAMDDIGLTSDVQRIQAQVRTQNSSKMSIKEMNSDVENGKSEVFQLSENFEQKASTIESTMVQKQEDKNIMEKATEGLSSIKDSFKNIEESAQKAQDSSLSEEELKKLETHINDNLEKADKVAKETSFNDKKVLDGSMSYKKIESATLKSFDIPKEIKADNKEDLKKLEEKTKAAQETITNRQASLQNESKKLVEEVDSILEINAEANSDSIEIKKPEQVQAVNEKIKQQVFKSPENSVKIQIKQLNQDLLLAMISL